MGATSLFFVKVVTFIWCVSSVAAGICAVDNEELDASEESLASFNDHSCNPTDESNFYAIRSILDNEVRKNDTLLRQLAGIFSDETHQPNQVVVTYVLCIRRNEDNCTFSIPNCNYAKFSNRLNYSDYFCITTNKFTWSPYSTLTAHDLVLGTLDACPLVIGPYQQESLTIYFNITTPPSCNSSLFNNDTINNKVFPCGWQCEQNWNKNSRDFKFLGLWHPKSLFFDNPLYDESHIDRVLLRITSKVCF